MSESSKDPLRLAVTVEDVVLLINFAEKYGIRNYDLIIQLYLQIGETILAQHSEGKKIILYDPKTRERVFLNIDHLIDGARIEDVMRPMKDK